MKKKMILDYSKYKGRGRPRKSDYITINEYFKGWNRMYNEYLNSLMRHTS